MTLKEVKELRDLNVELLETNLRLWGRITRFCAMHRIEVPYDPRLQYALRQAIEIVEEINCTSPKRNNFVNHPDTEQNPHD